MPQREYGRTVSQRLAMCRDLLILRDRVAASSGPQATVLAKTRQAAIRRALGVPSESSPVLSDELLSPAMAVPRLAGILDAVADRPAAEMARTGVYVQSLVKMMAAISRAERKHGAPPDDSGVADLLERAGQLADGADDGAIDEWVDGAIGGGRFDQGLRAELDAAARATEARRSSINSLSAQLAAKFDEIAAEHRRLQAEYGAAASQLLLGSGGVTRDRVMAIEQEYTSYRNEVFKPAEEAKMAIDREAREAEKSARATAGRKIADRLMASSPVSQEQADKWAEAQEITPQAKARLRKMGYPIDKVRADMAEFYRITGGRLPGARLHSDGDRRANATEIGGVGAVGTINMGSTFDRRVLWHELGHHLEADPVVKRAAGRFLRRRSTDDGKVHSLRSLTGVDYGSKEVAYKGDFFDGYVGKVYADGFTEVMSMGIDSFADPERLAKRAAVDPEMLEFVSGLLAQPMDELAQAHAAMRGILAEMTAEAGQAEADQTGDLLKKVAARVTLAPSDDRSWMGQAEWMLSAYKMVGYIDMPSSGVRWWILSGKVNNWGSRRKVSGFAAVQASGGGVRRIPIPSKDLNVVKASLYQQEVDGHMLSVDALVSPDVLRKLAS